MSIDSQFQESHETDSQINIQLSRPIENAKSVRLVSFSTANEFYNIEAGNNTFTLLSYSHSDLTNPPVKFEATINPGFYQAIDIIEEINLQLTERNGGIGNTGPGFDTISIVLVQLSSLKTQITASAGPASKKRLVIYVDREKLSKHTIAARLGFSMSEVVTTTKVGMFPNATTALESPLYETAVDFTTLKYKLWIPNTQPGQIRTGNNIAYETHSHIYVECDLVTDFRRLNIEENNKNVVKTHILSKIPISVNSYNWLHHQNDLNENMSHTLSNNSISSFNIWLSNENYDKFQNGHLKKYNVVLAFTTHDRKENVNEQSIEDQNVQSLKKKYYVI